MRHLLGSVLLLLAACATTLQRRADGLGTVGVDVRWGDGVAVVPIDAEAARRAFGKGASEAAAAHWLPFALDRDLRGGPVLTVQLGPAQVWNVGNGAVLLDLTVTATLRDTAGEVLDQRTVPCFDEGLPGRNVLVPDDYDAPGGARGSTHSRGLTGLATWDDLGRAWMALAEWCGGTLVAQMSRELR